MSERRGKSFISKTITAVVVFLFFGFVIVVVIPNFIRATYQSAANACINNLRQIDAAAQEFGLEKGKKAGDAIHYPDDLTPYIKLDSNGILLNVRLAALTLLIALAMNRNVPSGPPPGRTTMF
jgi:type II secretory pathway pseudopilin PulG